MISNQVSCDVLSVVLLSRVKPSFVYFIEQLSFSKKFALLLEEKKFIKKEIYTKSQRKTTTSKIVTRKKRINVIGKEHRSAHGYQVKMLLDIRST